MGAPNIPKRIMFFKDGIPDAIRVFLCLFFAVSFQFTGGIYLSSALQMTGSLAVMQEDIMMAGCASFVGMTIVFPVLFRLKFRFTTRFILLTVCPVLIVCNLIAMYTSNLFILMTVCFVAGIFRMWGTFECLSNVQLSITPTRDFAVFFPVVYLIVLGSIQLSGLVTVYIGYWANWKYMHLFIVALQLVVWLCVFLFTRPFRFMKPLPLYGIDWIGGMLWSVFLLSLIFVFEYGRYFDWLDSPYIRIGIVTAAVSLLLAVQRMFTRRHPFIERQAFAYKHIFTLLFLFLMICFLQATPTVLQNIFTGSILHYDVLNSISLNWWNFAGTVVGCAVTFYWHAKLHGGYKQPVFTGFFLLVCYQVFLYFSLSADMNIERLYFPTFLRGMGYIMLYISLTVYMTSVVPFQHFFQVLSILGFVRTGFGGPMGEAVYKRLYQMLYPENMQLLSTNLDAVNVSFHHLSFGEICSRLSEQVTLVTLKEIYGWVVIAGILLLFVILSYRFLNSSSAGRLPKMRSIKQIMRRGLPHWFTLSFAPRRTDRDQAEPSVVPSAEP